MKDNKYSMSFTTGSLFQLESVKFAELYLELQNWNSVRKKVLSENLLQARTLNTSQRVCREIISRLKKLYDSELDLLAHTHPQEQGYLLWLAICRRYKFIGEFAVEVIRERFITLMTDLQQIDFDSFFARKAEWHPEFDAIRPATRCKLRQVLFKILRETNLLTDNNIIHSPILSPQFIEAIPQNRRHDLLFFPIIESDVTG